MEEQVGKLSQVQKGAILTADQMKKSWKTILHIFLTY